MNELSQNYMKAKELDRRIKTSAQLAQQSLYDMCMGFKEMRDGKLYTELGYQSFEEYCEQETGFTRRNVYKYISVAEKLPIDFVNSSSQIGVAKLALLAKLSDEERTEISDRTDLTSTTVKELEAKIKELHKEAEMDRKEREDAHNSAMRYKELAECREAEKQRLEDRISGLQKQIKDLESRPIDVAVAEPSDGERRLQETIKSLERENIKQNELLEETYRNQTNELRKMLEEDKQEAIAKLRTELEETKAEYEKKLAEKPQAAPDDDKVKFKIMLSVAYDPMKRLTDFAKQSSNDVFKDKVKQLVSATLKDLEA